MQQTVGETDEDRLADDQAPSRRMETRQVPAIDSVREGPNDLSSRGDPIPERLIVEMTSVDLLHRVEDVLHVHEDRDSIHGVREPFWLSDLGGT